jgi:hypothetical protein
MTAFVLQVVNGQRYPPTSIRSIQSVTLEHYLRDISSLCTTLRMLRAISNQTSSLDDH